ncbi:MAG: OmpA family protein, partial [Bacteroidetes bacterium]|nr:OmpA family protein [Bacteroidota bacterium]
NLSANSSTGKYGANLPIGGSYTTIYNINGKEIFSETIDAPKGKGYQVLRREIPFYGDSTAVSKKDSSKDLVAINGITPCDPKKSNFQLYFKYNKKEIDIEASDFKAFIDELTKCLLNNPTFKINIESSASTVPTRIYNSNQNLANLRAKNAKDKVLKALIKKGLNKSQISFSQSKALVQGPDYNKDAVENKATYEQYQYIKIQVNPK